MRSALDERMKTKAKQDPGTQTQDCGFLPSTPTPRIEIRKGVRFVKGTNDRTQENFVCTELDASISA